MPLRDSAQSMSLRLRKMAGAPAVQRADTARCLRRALIHVPVLRPNPAHPMPLLR
jgi:hypothetical protein